MKNIIAAIIISLAVAALKIIIADTNQNCSPPKTAAPEVVYGFGCVRDSSQFTLRNKYTGFVSKVYYYNYDKVKKAI